MISPENVLSHKHLMRIIKKISFFLAFCDHLVFVDISFLVLKLFSYLFCQVKEEESSTRFFFFFWKYVSLTVLLGTALYFHLDCSPALTGGRL